MASKYLRGETWWISGRKDGKAFCYSLKTKDDKVAKYRLNEIENQLARGNSPLPETSLSALSILEEYKNSSAGTKKQKTIDNDFSSLKRFFIESHILRINQITEASLSKYISGKIKSEDKKTGLTPGTCNAIIKTAKTFLNWSLRNNYSSVNTLARMPKYKENRLPPRFLSKDEIKAILTASDAVGIGLFTTVALYTGMRFSEIARLTWGDFNFDRDEVTVRISKSSQFRVIPLHPTLKTMLITARGKPLQACFDMPSKAHTAYKMYLRRLESSCEAAKIENVDGWHTLRHTFASQLIMAGVDLVTVSKLLGHSNIKTTMIYSHLAQEHIKDGIKKLSF